MSENEEITFVKVEKVEVNENREYISIGNDKRKKIGEYNNLPVYAIGERVLYKNKLINIAYFDKKGAKRMVRHYNRKGVLDDSDSEIFMEFIEKGSNPFAEPRLMEKMIKKSISREYQLSCFLIPEYIAYETWYDYQKKDITKEELLWIHNNVKFESN